MQGKSGSASDAPAGARAAPEDAVLVAQEEPVRIRSVGRRLAVMGAVAAYCLVCWVVLFHIGSAAIQWARSSQSALAGTDNTLEPGPGAP